MNLPQSNPQRPPTLRAKTLGEFSPAELREALGAARANVPPRERTLVALLLRALAPGAELEPVANILSDVESTLRALALSSELPSEVGNVVLSCALRLEVAFELFTRTAPGSFEEAPDSGKRPSEPEMVDGEELGGLVSEARQIAEELRAEATTLGRDAAASGRLSLRLGSIADHLRDAERMCASDTAQAR